MRGAAGTVTADPRYPDVVTMLNKWHGEADAMLTLAVSNDPGWGQCGAAVTAIHDATVAGLPADLRAAVQANAPAASGSPAPVAGCEAALVANLGPEIDEIGQILNACCKLNWIDNSCFAAVTQNRASAPKPPAALHAADQDAATASCGFEFKAPTQTPRTRLTRGMGWLCRDCWARCRRSSTSRAARKPPSHRTERSLAGRRLEQDMHAVAEVCDGSVG